METAVLISISKKQIAEKDLDFDGSGNGRNQFPDVRKAVKLLNNDIIVSFFKDSTNIAIHFLVL